ncbi:hypothetical protein GDO86_015081 [Hymenochirus boettgeri]|uniref:Uncharacterized protein n=1 Tax=Hymenochirus boettgeri TaxID=247094 RepID=A0A8T2JX96_9PIPI|nr:hypothetical protein GDO86_015081 [Hymenochirus boettgeri]
MVQSTSVLGFFSGQREIFIRTIGICVWVPLGMVHIQSSVLVGNESSIANILLRLQRATHLHFFVTNKNAHTVQPIGLQILSHVFQTLYGFLHLSD